MMHLFNRTDEAGKLRAQLEQEKLSHALTKVELAELKAKAAEPAAIVSHKLEASPPVDPIKSGGAA